MISQRKGERERRGKHAIFHRSATFAKGKRRKVIVRVNYPMGEEKVQGVCWKKGGFGCVRLSDKKGQRKGGKGSGTSLFFLNWGKRRKE